MTEIQQNLMAVVKSEIWTASSWGSPILRKAHVLFFLIMATLVNSSETIAKGYSLFETVDVVEVNYGPEVVPGDWRLISGDAPSYPFDQAALRRGVARNGIASTPGLYWVGQQVQLFANSPLVIARANQAVGGGGDVWLRTGLKIERIGDDGMIELKLNQRRLNGADQAAFRVALKKEGVYVYYRGDEVGYTKKELNSGDALSIDFLTLGRDYAIAVDGVTIVSGEIKKGTQDNEGWTMLGAENAGFRLLECTEKFVRHAVSSPEWEKVELLYEEDFSVRSLEENWVVNGAPVLIDDGAFIFCNMSVGILRQRFDGPVLIEFEAEPVVSEHVTAGVTDAIFIWMMNWPNGELIPYLETLDNASRSNYDDLAFYWMDQGGSNNQTTRLRRNPGLYLVRQFDDAPRLLEPRRRYSIGLVQNGHMGEYLVDGSAWVQFYDDEPLVSGHPGVRGFMTGAPDGTAVLKITRMNVWKIANK